MSHDLLSPSGRDRWGVCAASVRESKKYPEPPSGPAAIAGTHEHTIIERSIHQAFADPLTWIGVKMIDHEGEFTVDREPAERAKMCIDYVLSRTAEMSDFKVLPETKVDPAPLVGRSDMKGTVDITIISGDFVELIDYKGGINPIPANCRQLQQYLVGFVAGHEWGRFTRFRLTIVQPKLALKGLKPISSHDCDLNDVVQWVNDLRAEGAATDDPNAPFTPGEIQCKYCPAAGACAARANFAVGSVGLSFGPVGTAPAEPVLSTGQSLVAGPAPDLSIETASKDPAKMDAQQLRQILEAAPLLRQMIAAAEEEVEKRLKSGAFIPGVKLVEGRGSRKWNQDDDATAEVLKKMGVPKDSVYETSVVSIAKAEKLRWKKRDGTECQLSPKQLERLAKEYVTHLGGKLTVALESDPRPAVSLNAAPLFSAIPAAAAPEPALPSWLS